MAKSLHRSRIALWIIVAWLFTMASSMALAAPPKVVKTIPTNNDQNVNATLREIRVKFDQNMMTGSFSVCGGGPTFPKIIGNPQWVSKRLIAIRVKLEPEHDYSFSINCPSAKNFKNTKGEGAEPYPMAFRTGKGTVRKLSLEDNKVAVAELKKAIDEKYSYRDLRKVDWVKLFQEYGPQLEKADSPDQFAKVAARLLAQAKDMHIWLTVDEKPIPTYKRKIEPNYNMAALAKLVPNWKKLSALVYTGRFDDGIGYILITGWENQHAEALDMAYEAIAEFADAKGLIVDVRPNAGGSEPLAQAFAGCFVDKPAVYAKHVNRTGAGPDAFGKTSERILQPNKRRPRYRGKTIVLMGPAVMSSCESFLLMMKQVPGCKLIGERSYGSSGNPKPIDLGNDVTLFLPSWKDLRTDGSCFEGQGIAPDITVKTAKGELPGKDTVLEAALKTLRQ